MKLSNNTITEVSIKMVIMDALEKGHTNTSDIFEYMKSEVFEKAVQSYKSKFEAEFNNESLQPAPVKKSSSKIISDNLKNKKITMATLKSFINKSEVLFTETKRSFCGMTDMVENVDSELRVTSKEDAIGFKGVYCVGSGRDYFNYIENETMYGINVYNSCGNSNIWTNK